MTYALGDVITQIGGAGVVREHTPLNIPVTTEGADAEALLGEVTIPAGHILAVEVAVDSDNELIVLLAIFGADNSWGVAGYSGDMTGGRATFMSKPGQEGPAMIVCAAANSAFTVTGITTTLIPTEVTPGEPDTPEPAPVTIVGTIGENITTDTFTPTIPNATTGDTIIIAANTKAVGGSTLTAPAGFTTLVDGYWKGTQRSWVFSGPWSGDLTVTADQPLEFGYAAVAVRGAASVTTGMVKDRETEPAESTTVTAPAVEHGPNDLVIGIAFERTSAVETAGQVTVNDGWTIEHYTAQGANFQTTLIGVGGTGDMVVTYPNPQALNGVGVQVVAHAAPAPDDTPVDTFLATRPFYVAHRLGGTEYPEHTMQGMNAAIDAGFTAFEFSTYRTRDGVFIGSHDWTTERTTGQYHEIWDTDWSTIQTLDQQAGPIIRLEDAVAAMPEGSVLVLDHKATSARSGFHADSWASESELFDLLDTLFDVPQDRVIWKLFASSDSDSRARERGYKTMCMLYPDEIADADLNRWDILGMEYNAPQEIWDTLLATGKPTIAHIIVNSGQAATGLSRGAHGLMSSVPSVVAPVRK